MANQRTTSKPAGLADGDNGPTSTAVTVTVTGSRAAGMSVVTNGLTWDDSDLHGERSPWMAVHQSWKHRWTSRSKRSLASSGKWGLPGGHFRRPACSAKRSRRADRDVDFRRSSAAAT